MRGVGTSPRNIVQNIIVAISCNQRPCLKYIATTIMQHISPEVIKYLVRGRHLVYQLRYPNKNTWVLFLAFSSQVQLPASAHHRRQQMMVKGVGSLLITWDTKIQFPDPGSSSWHSPRHCGHLGREPADGNFACLRLLPLIQEGD